MCDGGRGVCYFSLFVCFFFFCCRAIHATLSVPGIHPVRFPRIREWESVGIGRSISPSSPTTVHPTHRLILTTFDPFLGAVTHHLRLPIYRRHSLDDGNARWYRWPNIPRQLNSLAPRIKIGKDNTPEARHSFSYSGEGKKASVSRKTQADDLSSSLFVSSHESHITQMPS